MMKLIPPLMLSLFLNLNSFAQKLEVKLYNLENSLDTNNINDIIKDNEGNIWIATDTGLKKFDGLNFVDFKIASSFSNQNDIRKLLIFDNKLYIMYAKEGCLSLNLNDYKIEIVTKENISDIFINRNYQFILFADGKLLTRETNKQTRATIISRKNINHIKGSLVYFKKNLYVSIPNNGIFIRNKNEFIKISDESSKPAGYRERFMIHNDSLYYIGLNYPYLIDNKKLKKINSQLTSEHVATSDICFNNYNNYYYIDGNKRLFYYNKGIEKEIIFSKDKNIELRKIIFRNNNLILLATNQGLVQISINNSPIQNLINDYSENSKFFRIRRKILEINNGLVLFGNPNIITYSNGRYKTVPSDYLSIYDVVKVKNNYYAATEGNGVLIYSPNFMKYKKINLQNQVNNYNDHFCSILFDPLTSIIYAGNYSSIFCYNLNNKKLKKITIPFDGFMTKAIVKDNRNNRILVGTDNGAFAINSKNYEIIKNLNENNILHGSIIGDLLIDYKRDLLWIGHDKGIDVLYLKNYKQNRYLPLNFFSNPKTTCLIMDDHENIWASTYSGITGYNYKSNTYIRLQKNNGLINTEFNYKSEAKLKNGNLIFGGLNGYDIINVEKISFKNLNKKGIISGYHLFSSNDTTYNRINKTFKINYNSDIFFSRIYITTAPNTNPLKSNFEFKINDGPWINLKGRSFIDLIGLSPGEYTLSIRAFDEFGRLITFNNLDIQITQFFYKSPYFIITILITFICLLIYTILYIIRNNNVKKKIYEQIAMDLHDETGTILSRVLLLIKSSKIINSEVQNLIIEYLNEANFGLRTYINTVNLNNKSLIEIFDDSVEIFQKSLSIKNITLKHEFSGNKNLKIKSSLFRDIKLCLFEISNNIIKHSKANIVEFQIVEINKKIFISIKQNQALFNFKDIGIGNGLKNITKRITKNHGNITFEKNKNQFIIYLIFTIK